MTPSVSQSSGCRLRRVLCSVRPIPSLPCSSSMSRSCELLLFTMIGPILRRNIPSLYIGCTFEVSLVRRITDLSWKVDDTRRCWKLRLRHSPQKVRAVAQAQAKQAQDDEPQSTSSRTDASKHFHENILELWSCWQSVSQPCITTLIKSTSSYSDAWAC